jgi:cardiolipin synthase
MRRADGPDADIDNLPQLLLGVLAVARRRAACLPILPDDGLLRALQVAALRGVQVDILLPERSNVPLMNWAVTPQLPWLLDAGCRVYRTPSPFDHSKLFVVDGLWSMIGSTNWDARSLRLTSSTTSSATTAPGGAARRDHRREDRRARHDARGPGGRSRSCATD